MHLCLSRKYSRRRQPLYRHLKVFFFCVCVCACYFSRGLQTYRKKPQPSYLFSVHDHALDWNAYEKSVGIAGADLIKSKTKNPHCVGMEDILIRMVMNDAVVRFGNINLGFLFLGREYKGQHGAIGMITFVVLTLNR